MGFIDGNDEIRQWKYSLKEFNVLLSNGITMKIPTYQMVELSITEDFVNNLYPMIKVKAVLTTQKYYAILEDKNNCRVHIRIDKCYITKNNSSRGDSYYQKFINDTFDVVMDEGTDDLSIAEKTLSVSMDYTKLKRTDGEDDFSNVNNTITIYLFKNIDKTKGIVNKVFENCTVCDAVTWLLTQTGLSNVLMVQPDNTRVYEEFLIPPSTISKALMFIDSYYGIYKTGTFMYFGYDYTYFMPFKGSFKAKPRGERDELNIIVPKALGGYSNASGGLYKRSDPNSDYVVALYSSIKVSNNSISDNYTKGVSVDSIDTYDGGLSKFDSAALVKGNKQVEIKSDNSENNYFTSMSGAQSDAKSHIVSFTIMDYDISLLKPNKGIKMLFEDSSYTNKYKGTYKILSANHLFRIAGEDLLVTSNVVLAKD